MDERAGRMGNEAQPIYAIELREETEGATVAFIRIPRVGDGEGPIVDVWANRFSCIITARTVMRVMRGRQDQWASWGRMARILGTEFLTGVIEDVVVGATGECFDDPGSGTTGADHRGWSGLGARTVHLTLENGDTSRIVATRGGRRFMEMTFADSSDGWRAWDWIRWQSHQFQAWYALASTMGARALRSTIIRSILIDEAEAKASGRSAGGPRPLRDWHPIGPAEKPDSPDADSDD